MASQTLDGLIIFVYRENRSSLRGKKVLEKRCTDGTFLPACTDQRDGSGIEHLYYIVHDSSDSVQHFTGSFPEANHTGFSFRIRFLVYHFILAFFPKPRPKICRDRCANMSLPDPVGGCPLLPPVKTDRRDPFTQANALFFETRGLWAWGLLFLPFGLMPGKASSIYLTLRFFSRLFRIMHY
jgi:hypothetical protein